MIHSLKPLRYVLAVAATGHFRRAAERCNVSQPALSQQIAQLEAACGTPIFDRLPRAVRPTPFGRELIARARRVLEAAEALESFIESRTGLPGRPIRFGLIPTVAPYLLPDIFPALKDALPGLDFAVSESKTETLLAGLADGAIDLALIGTDPGPSGIRLETEALFEDRFVLASASAAEVRAPVDITTLDPEAILLLEEGHCFRDQALAACRLNAGEGGNAFAATSLSTIVEFVANGQGVTLLPGIALAKEAAGGRIAIHGLAAPGAGRLLRLVWREGSPFAASYRALGTVIRTARRDSMPGERAALAEGIGAEHGQ